MEDDPLLVNSDATADANCEPTDDGQELVPDGGHHAHPTNSWLATSAIIVANMLGAGVLGLPFATFQMGWVPAVIVLLAATAFSIYGGVLLGKLKTVPSIQTYGDLGYSVGQKINKAKLFKYICQVIGYIYIVGACTIYLTTCKLCLMQIFQSSAHQKKVNSECSDAGSSKHGTANLSTTAWLCVAAAILLPLAQVRSLSDAGIVAYIGVGTIAIVNFIVIGHSINDAVNGNSLPPGEKSNVFPDNFVDFVNGMTQLAFAYGGHVLMIEVQSTMVNPKDWPKALYSSQLFMFANYAVVGFLGFYVYGREVQAPITASLSDNGLRTFTNVCLFIHVAVAYCINSTVVVRAAMSFLWPDGLRDRNIARIMGRWFLLSTSLLALAVGISVVVPFFSSLMNIYASIGIFSLSFAVPVFFWMVFKSDSMRAFDQLWNALLILIAVVGCVLGCWAAIKDIVHKWKLCHYSI